jgi:hypothetical protein
MYFGYESSLTAENAGVAEEERKKSEIQNFKNLLIALSVSVFPLRTSVSSTVKYFSFNRTHLQLAISGSILSARSQSVSP